MLLDDVFERFVEESPVSVMARAVLENAPAPAAVDSLFEEVARRQYARDLLFSDVVGLMAMVVCKVRPSINAAFEEHAEPPGVPVRPSTTRSTAGSRPSAPPRSATPRPRLAPVVAAMGGRRESWPPGYRAEIPAGDREVHIPTDRPAGVAGAVTVADLDRRRWAPEAAFQEMEATRDGAIDALGYPGAALFARCVAPVSDDVMGALKGALRSVHGAAAADVGVSATDSAEEVAGTTRGLLIAIPEDARAVFHDLCPSAMVRLLQGLARRVRQSHDRKQPPAPRAEEAEAFEDQRLRDGAALDGETAERSTIAQVTSPTQGWHGGPYKTRGPRREKRTQSDRRRGKIVGRPTGVGPTEPHPSDTVFDIT